MLRLYKLVFQTCALFSYYFGKPCIMVKMNKVFDWRPQPYYDIEEIRNHTTMPKA